MNRKAIEDLILKTMDKMDPSKSNRGIYEKLFKSLNNKEFEEWAKGIGKDYHLAFTAPNHGEVKIDDIKLKKIAESMGLKVFERVIKEESGVMNLSPHPYNIVRLVLRRSNQHATSKIILPKDNKTRNPLTGQVTGASKGSGISMPESLIISSYGLDNTMLEFASVRGGDTVAMANLEDQVFEKGYVSIKNVGSTKSRAVKSMIEYFRAMHMELNT